MILEDFPNGEDSSAEKDEGAGDDVGPSASRAPAQAVAAASRWTRTLTDVQKSPFSGPTPGPTVTLEEDKNELDFLNLFFPASCYDTLRQTNLYARRCQAARGTSDKRWSPVSRVSLSLSV